MREEPGETFTFTVNRRQLRVIRTALDMYARLGMGQFEVVIEEFCRGRFFGKYYEKEDAPRLLSVAGRCRGDVVADLVAWTKLLVFGHPRYGSWGIYSEEVPSDCREAYDIRQIVGKADVEASRREGVDRSWDVDNRSYLPTNPEEPPIKIESSRADADVPPES